MRYLLELRPKMKPGATLFVVTHDEGSLLAKITRARWPAYCLQHPHLFNPESMEKLMRNAGFKLETTRRSVNHFPAPFLVQQAALVGGIKLDLSKLPPVQIPLALGNFITIARPA